MSESILTATQTSLTGFKSGKASPFHLAKQVDRALLFLAEILIYLVPTVA